MCPVRDHAEFIHRLVSRDFAVGRSQLEPERLVRVRPELALVWKEQLDLRDVSAAPSIDQPVPLLHQDIEPRIESQYLEIWVSIHLGFVAKPKRQCRAHRIDGLFHFTLHRVRRGEIVMPHK